MPVTCTASNLVTLSACFNGLTPDQQSAIQIYLLCQFAGGSCGTPTLNITVIGAGTGNANGIYTSTDAGVTFVNPSGFVMFSNGTHWLIVDGGANTAYLIPVDGFPCGTWTQGAAGSAPSPTAGYT